MSVSVCRRASALAAIASAFAVSTFLSVDASAQFAPITAQVAPAQTTVAPITTVKTPTAAVEVDLGVYDSSIVAHPAYALEVSTDGTSSAACPNDPAAYNWSRTWAKSGEFGNSTFGAGYDGNLTVTSTVGGGTQPDKIMVSGDLRGLATIFGDSVTMVEGSGWASLAGNVGSASASLQVLGATLWTDSGSTTLSANRTFNATFFSADTWIVLGIVPVHFTATASGQLGYSYNVQTIGNSINLTFNPWAKAYATASAGVDLWLAGAGVEGTLTLVQVSAPSHGVLSLYPTNVQYNVNADVQVQSLSGEIDAYATVPGKKWTTELASWPPAYSATFPVIHANSCQTGIQHSTCGNHVCDGNENYVNCPSDCPAPPPPPPDGGGDGDPPICQIQPWKCPQLP